MCILLWAYTCLDFNLIIMQKLNEEWKNNLDIQRKMLIDKACEWLQANANKYIVDIGIRDVNLIIGDKCWADFRKAMEE